MIKFLDLHKINHRFQVEFQSAFVNALEDSNYVSGSNVSRFENEFAAYCGANHCIGVGNGLDAMTLILKAYIHLGKLQKGDKIIVPANTFIATILSVLHADLVPVLVEPDADTYNLKANEVSKHLNQNVKAIIMVHLYGQLADAEGLNLLAKTHNLLLIEDAAQAHGAVANYIAQNSNQTVLKAGNLSHAAAFSFYPSKNLGALGDAGAVTTSDPELYQAINLLRNYGSKEKYKNEIVGYNSRLDTIQASFLSIKLKVLDLDNLRRRTIAKTYHQYIDNPKLHLPSYSGSENHVFYAFVVEVDDRDAFIQFLDKNEVQWLIHYPVPPHQQQALKEFADLNFPITEKIHNRIISLPISPVLSDAEVKTVISVLNNY